VKSLVDVVSKDNFIHDSEYLETVLVAVPKYVTVLSFDVIELMI
jgi:V-type H+-transporting ATPase subunit C